MAKQSSFKQTSFFLLFFWSFSILKTLKKLTSPQ